MPKKIETSTARSLKPPKTVKVKKKAQEKDRVEQVLDKLFSLATTEDTTGNTTAAKIFLDVMLKQKGVDTDALTPEEALEILRRQHTE